ncbi:hypothetical protein BU23DRAFT_444032 [Bimuria novae-zelandiae CBS 107.79]|uniref:Uncharacterized protein n=1 Tax=Bimuria novae-zelandiae CBS 107.79 TaxID=1447943 RepID=A0A6A5VYS5_9PLEO|nr:hypothetical protein BU23DRAFT_444032 [Bimuria novae-zelandiae CBS 107.79]
MQLHLTVAALVATAAAANYGTAKIVNRCPYTVYVWSIFKEEGCATNDSFKLKPGGTYTQEFRGGKNMSKEERKKHDGGISLKLSKFPTCSGKDITQLEYKINDDDDEPDEIKGNFLDMSFVDCIGNLEDCPGRTDGFYLKSGNKDGAYTSAVNNEHCPVFNVYNAEEAAKVSYINWDDPQTKFCDFKADLDLYLCGGDAPDADDDSPEVPTSSTAPSSSSKIESSSAPSPTSYKQKPTPSTPAAPSSTEDAFVVAAAAVTEAPKAPTAPVIKTEVVYVTEYVDRRQVHAHKRRHQHFHA